MFLEKSSIILKFSFVESHLHCTGSNSKIQSYGAAEQYKISLSYERTAHIKPLYIYLVIMMSPVCLP